MAVGARQDHTAARDRTAGLGNQDNRVVAHDQGAKRPARDAVGVENGLLDRHEGVEVGRAGRADFEGHERPGKPLPALRE